MNTETHIYLDMFLRLLFQFGLDRIPGLRIARSVVSLAGNLVAIFTPPSVATLAIPVLQALDASDEKSLFDFSLRRNLRGLGSRGV